jgi:hypothetical protein
MAELQQQDLKHHARFDPLYHGVAAVFLLALLVSSIVLFVQNLHGNWLLYAWLVLLSIVLWILTLKLRMYPLKVQDRVIRLEERLRLSMLLPEGLRHRVSELSEDQLIGLRFASDDEVPALVKEVLEKQLSRKQIKERIQNWRPDHWRV